MRCRSFVQALLRIADVSYLSRERSATTSWRIFEPLVDGRRSYDLLNVDANVRGRLPAKRLTRPLAFMRSVVTSGLERQHRCYSSEVRELS